MAKDEAKKRVGTDDILAVCLKDNAKVIGELIYEKGEFDAMEIVFFSLICNIKGKDMLKSLLAENLETEELILHQENAKIW